jgi:hypothetical protein
LDLQAHREAVYRQLHRMKQHRRPWKERQEQRRAALSEKSVQQ